MHINHTAMTNNDIFKKLRVALQLRDDQIVEILELVDFRISKGEIGNFFRNEDHPKYMECGDQVLRNFLNALIIFLRGTKEAPKNPMEVLNLNKENVQANLKNKPKADNKEISKKPTNSFSKEKPKTFSGKKTFTPKETKPKVFEPVRFKNGKKKD